MEQARIRDTIGPVIEAVIVNLGEIFFFSSLLPKLCWFS